MRKITFLTTAALCGVLMAGSASAQVLGGATGGLGGSIGGGLGGATGSAMGSASGAIDVTRPDTSGARADRLVDHDGPPADRWRGRRFELPRRTQEHRVVHEDARGICRGCAGGARDDDASSAQRDRHGSDLKPRWA